MARNNEVESFLENIHDTAYRIDNADDAFKLFKRQKIVLSLIQNIKPARILDVGFNYFKFDLLLKSLDFSPEVKLLDLDKNRVSLAVENGFDAFQCDVSNENLPFPDSYFDVVYAGEIIEHLFDTEHFVSEVKRVLKLKSGIFILSTPNLAAWYNRVLFPIFGIQPFHTEVALHRYYGRKPFKRVGGNPVGHIHVFTTKAIKEFLNANGFSIKKIIGYPFKEKNVFDLFFASFPSLSSGVIIISTYQ